MRTLRLPESIDSRFFVLVWDPATEMYVLTIPNGSSYEIGDAQETQTYLEKTLELGMLGERAMDSARNWYTAVVIPAENRCFGVTPEEVNLNERKRLLGETEPDPVIV